MEVGSWLWKSSYMMHVISNAAFFGISLVFTFADEEMLKEKIVKKYLKFASLFVFLTGATGILLLSILSMNGMDDLTNNPIGQSALIMILGYTVVLFVFSLALIYKGGEARIYKKLFGIMFFSYLFVYIARVYLTT
ncbi:MAG: hypothetical protein GXN94_03880 [Aquificae bacterium]|nr:hypothetical protein [Aquificota bacterium]